MNKRAVEYVGLGGARFVAREARTARLNLSHRLEALLHPLWRAGLPAACPVPPAFDIPRLKVHGQCQVTIVAVSGQHHGVVSLPHYPCAAAVLISCTRAAVADDVLWRAVPVVSASTTRKIALVLQGRKL